jgi:hypothetical protein
VPLALRITARTAIVPGACANAQIPTEPRSQALPTTVNEELMQLTVGVARQK